MTNIDTNYYGSGQRSVIAKSFAACRRGRMGEPFKSVKPQESNNANNSTDKYYAEIRSTPADSFPVNSSPVADEVYVLNNRTDLMAVVIAVVTAASAGASPVIEINPSLMLIFSTQLDLAVARELLTMSQRRSIRLHGKNPEKVAEPCPAIAPPLPPPAPAPRPQVVRAPVDPVHDSD